MFDSSSSSRVAGTEGVICARSKASCRSSASSWVASSVSWMSSSALVKSALSFMGSLFVKLHGVGTVNVTRQIARLFRPCRHFIRRAVHSFLGCLRALARAGARVLVRRDGKGFSVVKGLS